MSAEKISSLKPSQSPSILAGFLSNVRVGWKMGLMVLTLSLGTLGVTYSAYVGLQSLRYQLSNIYDFMLIPIVAINHADAALAEVQYNILQSHNEDLSPAKRQEFLNSITPANQVAEETITRYDTEWVTTVSPEFTQSLREAGKLALQEQEVTALADYHASYEAYLASLEKYLVSVEAGSASPALADETIANLLVARVHLQELIDVNNNYADFSNNLALAAYTQAFVTSGISLAVALAIGLLFSYLIATSIATRLGALTRGAEAIQKGNLEQNIVTPGRDEVGILGATFNAMARQIKDFIATLEQRVADRTKALATSTEVSRRLSTLLEQGQLVKEVVEEVRNSFGYYHTHIYLVDSAQDELVMAGGTGEAGRKMLESGHRLAKGQGLVGRAAQSNEPVLVADTTQSPEWLPNPLLPDTKSEVAIPIALGSQVVGVLDVQHNIVDGLGREDVDALQSIANQIAVAMQNIRQYENTQKIASDLSVVANVGIATSTITEIDRLLQEVVDLSKKSFNLYHAHIYLLNEAGDTLDLTAGAGDVGRQMVKEGRHIPLMSEKSLVARAARAREGVVVNNVTEDPDFLPHPLLPNTHAEMAVPMIAAGNVLGVLDVQSETVGRFTEVDVNIKTTLASQVAVAVQNARSFADAQRRAERETLLNVISQKIQGATTIESAMQVAARELGHALGMKPTLVALDPSALAGGQAERQ